MQPAQFWLRFVGWLSESFLQEIKTCISISLHWKCFSCKQWRHCYSCTLTWIFWRNASPCCVFLNQSQLVAFKQLDKHTAKIWKIFSLLACEQALFATLWVHGEGRRACQDVSGLKMLPPKMSCLFWLSEMSRSANQSTPEKKNKKNYGMTISFFCMTDYKTWTAGITC